MWNVDKYWDIIPVQLQVLVESVRITMGFFSNLTPKCDVFLF